MPCLLQISHSIFDQSLQEHLLHEELVSEGMSHSSPAESSCWYADLPHEDGVLPRSHPRQHQGDLLGDEGAKQRGTFFICFGMMQYFQHCFSKCEQLTAFLPLHCAAQRMHLLHALTRPVQVLGIGARVSSGNFLTASVVSAIIGAGCTSQVSPEQSFLCILLHRPGLNGGDFISVLSCSNQVSAELAQMIICPCPGEPPRSVQRNLDLRFLDSKRV